jgi:CubicO group peptidase (beta-lactamase class C family)
MKNILLLLILINWTTACVNSQKSENSNNTHANDNSVIIDNYLSKLAQEKNFSGGLLIIKDGKQLLSKGYGWADKDRKIPFSPSTLASMGSITKAFTATAIMKLVEQNKLSVEDKLGKFFPTVPSDKANITIHQLLTHSSGFHEFLKDDGGDYEIIKTEAFLKRAFSEPLAFKPGEKAVYTNVGMSVLAIIIEQVTGLDYEQYLKTNLFDPLSIKAIGYRYPALSTDTIAVGYENGKVWGTHQERFAKAGGGPYWNLKGNGGLEASLNDMFLWANSFTNNTILKASTIETMFKPHVLEEGYNGQSSFGYGCNISKSRRNTKMIGNGGSNGIYHARLIRLPEEGLVFYMVTNENSVNAMKVLPNVTQLYFKGAIEQDALAVQSKFENPMSKQIYDLIEKPTTTDLGAELTKANLKVDDDIILLEVGQTLIEEKKMEKALILYTFYTKTFPNIVVSWNDLGDIYLTQNNKSEAIKCYKQALKIRPTNPRAIEALSKLE